MNNDSRSEDVVDVNCVSYIFDPLRREMADMEREGNKPSMYCWAFITACGAATGALLQYGPSPAGVPPAEHGILYGAGIGFVFGALVHGFDRLMTYYDERKLRKTPK